MEQYTPFTEIERLYRQQVAKKDYYKLKDANWRKILLQKLSATINAYQEDIKQALHQDFNKNAVEAEITEIMAVQMEIREAASNINRWMQDRNCRRSWKFFSIKPYLHYEPKGNTLIITPWNYPFQLPMSHLVSSVAAGNTVMLKLSEHAWHSNQVIRRIVQDVFEEEHVCVVEGAVAETTFLLGLRFDHIHFTGSSAIGKVVMQAASHFLSGVTLELGGKSPAIVDKDVAIREVVKNLIWAKFINAGQTCIAPDYVLIDSFWKGQVERIFVEEIQHAFGADASQSPDLARIINDRQYERLADALRDAVQRGASTLVGGQTDARSRFVAPTVITAVDPEAVIMQEEIFGPLLPIVFYNEVDEAFVEIKGHEKPLAMYIFSKNSAFVKRVIANTTAGGTCVNDAMVHVMHPSLPFGGVNNSGIGQSFGWYGFRAFSHERAIADVKLMPLSKFFWFPYTDKTTRLLRLFRRFMA
jgi:aldehyde dehydrogenase (NAD+)